MKSNTKNTQNQARKRAKDQLFSNAPGAWHVAPPSMTQASESLNAYQKSSRAKKNEASIDASPTPREIFIYAHTYAHKYETLPTKILG
ncbi:MAG: hypothetical protein KC736_04510, partial [Candidatus Moranbacteria bacterium]|nr:hypothetical protein [Candidatus Moranbacteria bacterium]